MQMACRLYNDDDDDDDDAKIEVRGKKKKKISRTERVQQRQQITILFHKI